MDSSLLREVFLLLHQVMAATAAVAILGVLAVVCPPRSTHAQPPQRIERTATGGIPTGDSLSPFARAKAETLLRDRLPCLGCHALSGSGGRVGPDLSTVLERRSREYVVAIIADPRRVAPGSIMPTTPMTTESRVLVTAYVLARASAHTPRAAAGPVTAVPTASSSPTPTDTDGTRLYARYCAACHGASGKGDGQNARFLPVPPADHTARSAMAQRSDDSLYDTIFAGGVPMNRSAYMPAYGETLTREQIRALVRRIRRLCACTGPPWSIGGQRAPHE
jgi:mono/diheme cytochrome c family protein